MLKSNVFYVASEKTVYICWEKASGITEYVIMRNGKEIASSETYDFTRPYEFENDFNPYTELFKPATRNWLYFKDHSVYDFQHYQYQIIGKGGHTSDKYESLITEVYTE
mgnify:CR=1 FL=1